MEIFEPVRELTNKINSMKPSLDIDKIIVHIERAFQLFTQGVESGEEQNYTDVIYRCNQAFEGCSRQAFLVLAVKTEEELHKTQAWKIEKYLIDNEVLNERLLPLFKNYREKWRNESSHNFKLFFKEEEAYIAILSICSYAYVLLNQIVLNVSLSDIQGMAPTNGNTKSQYTLVDDLSILTKSFLQEVDLEKYKSGSKVPRISEIQFNGLYASFIRGKMPNALVNVDGQLGFEKRYRYDILVEREEEKVIIELKSIRFQSQVTEAAKEQLMNYLSLIEGAKGILFLFDGIVKMNDLRISDFNIEKDNRNFKIRVFEGIK